MPTEPSAFKFSEISLLLDQAQTILEERKRLIVLEINPSSSDNQDLQNVLHKIRKRLTSLEDDIIGYIEDYNSNSRSKSNNNSNNDEAKTKNNASDSKVTVTSINKLIDEFNSKAFNYDKLLANMELVLERESISLSGSHGNSNITETLDIDNFKFDKRELPELNPLTKSVRFKENLVESSPPRLKREQQQQSGGPNESVPGIEMGKTMTNLSATQSKQPQRQQKQHRQFKPYRDFVPDENQDQNQNQDNSVDDVQYELKRKQLLQHESDYSQQQRQQFGSEKLPNIPTKVGNVHVTSVSEAEHLKEHQQQTSFEPYSDDPADSSKRYSDSDANEDSSNKNNNNSNDSATNSNQQIYKQQQQVLLDQDTNLDDLAASVRRQREMGMSINSELDSQMVILDDLEMQIDHSDRRLVKAKRNLNRINRKMREHGHCFVITVLVVILFVLVIIF